MEGCNLSEIERASHDNEEKQAPRDVGLAHFLYVEHSLDHQGPMDPMDPLRVISLESKKKPMWLQSTLQYVQGNAAHHGNFREKKCPKNYLGYVALMCHIVDSKPYEYEEETCQQVWNDAMTKEYQSMMNDNVWEIVSRPKGKLVLTSKWINKMKHVVGVSIKNQKVRFL